MEQVVVALQALLAAVISVLVTIVLPIVTRIAVKWLNLKLKELEARLTEQQVASFRDIIIVAISAAEKLGATQALMVLAEQKKAYAIAVVQAYVDAHKLNIPVAQIEAEIENAVHLGLHKVDGSTDDEPSKPLGFNASMSAE